VVAVAVAVVSVMAVLVAITERIIRLRRRLTWPL
jgi:hypothetical protein